MHETKQKKTKNIRARLDSYVKLLFSHRQIIARLLKSCVPEYGDYSIPDIADHFLDGKDYAGEYIGGTSVESASVTDGKINFDVLVYGRHPHLPNARVGIVINVEVQTNMNPGYKLANRAVYYCSRLISTQKNRLMTDDDYDDLRQVCSIWICPGAPKAASGLARRVVLSEQSMCGGACMPYFTADQPSLISIYFLAFNGETAGRDENEIIPFLRALLSEDITDDERQRIIDSQSWISEKFKKEVVKMCNYGEWVYNRGVEKGKQEGKKDGKIEGKKEGKKEGKIEGKKEGIEVGIEKGLKMGRKEGKKEGIKEGLEKGIAQGMEKGIAQGMEKAQKIMAERLLKACEPIEKIIEMLGLCFGVDDQKAKQVVSSIALNA